MNIFDPFFVMLCFMLFALRRGLRYLHVYQQEEYDSRRFLRWMIGNSAIDKRLSFLLLALWATEKWIDPFSQICSDQNILAVILPFAAAFETDPRRVAKKKLVMTRRAWRIFTLALLLCLGFGCLILMQNQILYWITAVQFIPFSLVFANLLLSPLENHIQQKIMREASARLAELNPQVIGITGSFGKTSVKHILGHILAMNAPTLFTPGSVNTLMGISRIIREKLQPATKFFIVEMGAYAVGSIARLCRLTPPQLGILTAIGDAHYERFKSLDAVARAKFQLAEAVLAQSGKMIIHSGVLAQPYAQEFVARHRQNFIICGQGAACDLRIQKSEQTAAGLNVAVEWRQQIYHLFAPLYGAHHGGNMVLAFAASLQLGITPDRAIAALRTTPQIKHRLEVKQQASSILIDDGFNSNQQGFMSALELLSALAKEKPGRRILITPGIVELGVKHDEVHLQLGRAAAQHVDIAFVVRADHIPTFVEGFKSAAPDKALHQVSGLAAAMDWLRQKSRTGDIVLIENDLPDSGESALNL